MKQKNYPIFAIILLCMTSIAYAGGTPEDSGYGIHVTGNQITAAGADVVAYFGLKVGEPAVMGDERYAHEWNGATWLFANAVNRDAFAADPQKFAPAFGGYCSWAMARNKLATIDPNMWYVADGTLYLNYNEKTHKEWLGNRVEFINKARANWPEWEEKLSASR
jgi:hypothetical protein